MAQLYTDPLAQTRMNDGTCPECGQDPGEHSDSAEFWIPRTCDLTRAGVEDRINAFLIGAKYVGLQEDDAARQAGGDGLVVRIARRDENYFVATRDYRKDRVNFEIESGVVVRVRVG